MSPATDPPTLTTRYPDGLVLMGACCDQSWPIRNGGYVCGCCGTVWTVPSADCSGGWGGDE